MPTTPPFSFGAGDPAPVELVREDGKAAMVVVCEHGGRAVPEPLRDRMPPASDMDRHIAWDVGAADIAHGISAKLDAPVAIQRYSRLVIDCNRRRHAMDLTPAVSDQSAIPFNAELNEAEIDARWHGIHQPFHDTVANLFDQRDRVALVAIHSFTPQMRDGATRPMEVGLLVRQDPALAIALREEILTKDSALEVVFNAPYRVDDDSDYTIPVHGEARLLPHVLIEIRNDLIANAAGAEHWADLMADALAAAVSNVLEPR
ncbi:MAG: N-formylglutamate amidohydrolase [Pseudomonadota bacterium]